MTTTTTPMDLVIREAQERPGEWLLVYPQVSSSMGTRYRMAGCEVRNEPVPGLKNRYTMYARWPLDSTVRRIDSDTSGSSFALKLYNASLESRGLPTVTDWSSISPAIRVEFDAIAREAKVWA